MTYKLIYHLYKVSLSNPAMDKVNPLHPILDTHIILEKWCKHNCEGDFSGYVSCWSFELESDAVQFKLTWG